MPEEVHIRLFGELELCNAHGRISENRFRQSRPWLLLKYLLVNQDREVDQTEVLEKVWTDTEDQAGGNASRVRLKRLREALAPLQLDGVKGLVLFARGKYRINPQYALHTDADLFLEKLDRLRDCPAGEPEGLRLCTGALELFRGPYLEYSPDAPWAEPYRQFYNRKFQALAWETLAGSKAQNDGAALPLLCRRAAAIVPEDAALHKEIIRYLTETHRERHLVPYIAQLSRSGRNGGAKWLDEFGF